MAKHEQESVCLVGKLHKQLLIDFEKWGKCAWLASQHYLTVNLDTQSIRGLFCIL